LSQYPHLLEPLELGSFSIANRVVMGAMHTRLETLDRTTERTVAFFRARALGEVGLILTGGHAPSEAGRMDPESPVLDDESELDHHRAVCAAVHGAGSRIVLQILHAGRYGKVPSCVGPSAARARINPFFPHALSTDEVWEIVHQFARTATLARAAGYDGVEIMGSEGYLISQFAAASTNDRDDEFGRDLDGRLRLALEILRAVREAVGPDLLVIYRISALDLVDGGLTGAETRAFARSIERAGANVINTGIGWHESQVPTIAASVPRAAWAFAVRSIKRAVSVPVIASNRINTPEVAEALLAEGTADLVSMARPLLADPSFVRKARRGRSDEIAPCIACNQACLDRIFTDQTAACMLNPRAGHEIEFPKGGSPDPKRIGVVGGGPAGMAFALNAAERGHRVTLFEAAPELGGQLKLARRVPGKSEFDEALRYFRVRLRAEGVEVRTSRRVTADDPEIHGFDELVIATGVTPRTPSLPGIDHPIVTSYVEILDGTRTAGRTVAIIGAGGIGFDVAEYLVGDEQESTSPAAFLAAWGVDERLAAPGGLASGATAPRRNGARAVTMLQRKESSLGRSLGMTTGWILKSRLRKAGVELVPGATYHAIDDDGLHFSAGRARRRLDVDTVVVCAGQESERSLYDELLALGLRPHLIGGAHTAAELDAVAAIDQATRLAVEI
jgi:2,4-dienoyl-CoA reductase (NADPH2)